MTTTDMFWVLSCTCKILLSKHCNQAKAKQAGAVAPYTEMWANNVGYERGLPKSSPSDCTQRSKGLTSWAWFRLPW